MKMCLPSRRKLIQLYSFLLYNAHLKGLIKGSIYTGSLKAACVPGLNCYSCPGAVAACPLGALQNAIAASGHKAPFYVIGILLLYGLILGRTVCGFLCPFGLIQEVLNKIPSFKLPKGRVTRAFSLVKYAVLLVFVILLPLSGISAGIPLPALCKYICPAGTLEGAAGLLVHPANHDKFSMLASLFTSKFLILVLLLFLSVWIYRVFCRFLCPLGAIYALFNRFSVIGVRVDDKKCIDCGKCVAHCKMDVRHVSDRECIQCGSCITACPTGAISIKAGSVTLKGPDLPKGEEQSHRLLKRIFAAACALLLAFALVFSNLPDKESPASLPEDPASSDALPVGYEAGMRAPDFTCTLMSGEKLTLSSLRGKTVVLNFWATWCAPCVKELPYFEAFSSAHKDDAVVIALHSNLVTEDVHAYLSDKPFSFPFALDPTGEIISSFNGSNMLPQTIVIDKNGVITYNATGSITPEMLETLFISANQ